MVLGAGGQILEHSERGPNATVAINSAEGREAATLIRKVAISKSATPILSSRKRRSLEPPSSNPTVDSCSTGRTSTRYSRPTCRPARLISFMDDLAWARFPRVRADKPSRPPLGGNNLVISRFSTKKDLAYQFVKCAVSPESEKINLLVNGWPAANGTVYDDPESGRSSRWQTSCVSPSTPPALAP